MNPTGSIAGEYDGGLHPKVGALTSTSPNAPSVSMFFCHPDLHFLQLPRTSSASCWLSPIAPPSSRSAMGSSPSCPNLFRVWLHWQWGSFVRSFLDGRNIASNPCEDVRALATPKTARDLLAHLYHANILLRPIIGIRYPKVVHES